LTFFFSSGIKDLLQKSLEEYVSYIVDHRKAALEADLLKKVVGADAVKKAYGPKGGGTAVLIHRALKYGFLCKIEGGDNVPS
jgi:hypothetical protein